MCACACVLCSQHLDYEVIQSTNPAFNRAVVRVNVFKDHRQTIQYIQPHDRFGVLRRSAAERRLRHSGDFCCCFSCTDDLEAWGFLRQRGGDGAGQINERGFVRIYLFPFQVVLMRVCVCVFIKLHITAQSGLVILVILCHSR